MPFPAHLPYPRDSDLVGLQGTYSRNFLASSPNDSEADVGKPLLDKGL